MKYNVGIRETLVRTIKVEADSIEKAKEIARRKYDNEEIVLDNMDFNGDVDVRVYDEQFNPLEEWDDNFLE